MDLGNVLGVGLNKKQYKTQTVFITINFLELPLVSALFG